MADSVKASATLEIFHEDELKRLSRGIKDFVPHNALSEDDRIRFLTLNDRLLFSATSPSLLATHRVAAWNALCALIDEIARSDDFAVYNLLWEHRIWYKALGLYLDESQHARPKSAKQLLTTLGNALRNADTLADVQNHVTGLVPVYIEDGSRPRQAKAFLQLLAHFLGKDLLNLGLINRALDTERSVRELDLSENSANITPVLTCLFRWASCEDFGSVAGRCISAVLDKHSEINDGRRPGKGENTASLGEPAWSESLSTVLENHEVDIEQLRIHVFPVLFKRSLSEYISFLYAHGLDRLLGRNIHSSEPVGETGDRQLLYAALQTGKELALIVESEGTELRRDETVLRIPVQRLGYLLRSADRRARITGLAILVQSHTATRPFLRKALHLVKAVLPSFFADTDADFRGELFSCLQRLVDRMRAITASLARTTSTSTSNILRMHEDFLQWLLRFLTWELRPTASYQRHISAAKVLTIIARSGIDRDVPLAHLSKMASAEAKWPFAITVFHSGLQKLLMELLVDPFDDVRQTASLILSMYSGKLFSSSGDLNATIERAEKIMLASGRADQADGVAHMYALLAQTSARGSGEGETRSQTSYVLLRLIHDLEQTLGQAESSLHSAAKSYPMHGLLTSIRFSLALPGSAATDTDVARLTPCLHRVWEIVKPVLCNDAPEGYEHEDATESSSRDILSYCWRALKESSLLLGVLVANKKLPNTAAIELGDLCFAQLAELRHRGAFSTVAQTWVLCCGRVAALDTPTSVLESWYGRTLDVLKHKTTINTRRSAGIPSLICGLLVADRSGATLSQAFQDLSSIAQEPVDLALTNESSLPQVHALNCIKDILKNSRLGERSEQYVAPSLSLAAESLHSPAWALRNCGLMLYRAVMDRLLGTSDAHLDDDGAAQKRIAVQQHPQLLEIVLGLLEIPRSGEDRVLTARCEGVFPALQMLQRMDMDLPADRQQQALSAVLALTASPSWHVRDKAARTYASLAREPPSLTLLIDLLPERSGNENGTHGILLSLRFLASAVVRLLREQPKALSTTQRVSEAFIAATMHAFAVVKAECRPAHPVTASALGDALIEHTRLRKVLRQNTRQNGSQDGPSLKYDFLTRLAYLLERPDPVEFALEAVKRASLARATAQQLLSEDATSKMFHSTSLKLHLDTIWTLSQVDADACIQFWRTLHTQIAVASGMTAAGLGTTLLESARSIMSDSAGPIRLKCEVQRFLLVIFDRGCHREGVLSVYDASCTPISVNSNQTFADQWLELHAVALDSRLARLEPGEVQARFLDFISMCKAAVSDTKPDSSPSLFSREAAALSLSRMQHLWASPVFSQSSSSAACDLYLTIYDLLNDDDEDLRILAAHIVSRILQVSKSSTTQKRETHFEPITASQRLLSHMLIRQGHSRYFATTAFIRAFGNVTDEAVVDQLHALTSRQDTSLFATEKQNLYIDPAREVKAWSQVLLRIPVTSMPKRLIKDLTFWVDEGLYTLTSRLEKDKRQGDDVGALGWTSKEGVFVLGLKVVLGVEVLMGYVRRGGNLPMEGSEVIRRLVLFHVALEEATGQHVLWLWEVERVLKDYVLERVKLAWTLADGVRKAAARR